MRIVLLILGIWVLINVLFVVVMVPKVKRRYPGARRSSGANKEAYPFDGEERASLRFIIIAVATGAFFSLSPPIADAAAAIRRAFSRRSPPTE